MNTPLELATAPDAQVHISPVWVWYYLGVVNLITFFLFLGDKLQAGVEGRRIRERTLWIAIALGGMPGALLAMKLFRHKTRKTSFQLGAVLIVVIQIALIVWLLEQ